MSGRAGSDGSQHTGTRLGGIGEADIYGRSARADMMASPPSVAPSRHCKGKQCPPYHWRRGERAHYIMRSPARCDPVEGEVLRHRGPRADICPSPPLLLPRPGRLTACACDGPETRRERRGGATNTQIWRHDARELALLSRYFSRPSPWPPRKAHAICACLRTRR
jgi:hypothetical protein